MLIDKQPENGKELDFHAICKPAEVAKFEDAARDWGVNRRVAFVIASKSRWELTEVVRNLAADNEEALFEMLDGIRGLIEHYKSCLDMFSAVEARILVAASDAFDIPFD